MKDSLACEIVVVGAGPAGLAAACTAAGRTRSVVIVDGNTAPGGQIWRGEVRMPGIDRARISQVRLLCDTLVVGCPGDRSLLAVQGDRAVEIRYEKLILATGARERFLPFPGWTLPSVVGAGGLQAIVKGGMRIAGKRVVIAGSGPLLLAVAAYLCRQGARIAMIAEQAPRSAVFRFARTVARSPRKLLQTISLMQSLTGTPYRTGCWPTEAVEGAVTLSRGGKTWSEPCDYLACGFGLVPNTELAALLGCALQDGFVAVDTRQQTTQPGVFCAGEPTGIGGVEAAIVEGRIAGYCATGRMDEAARLFPERDRGNRFRRALEEAFRLRPELAGLTCPDTIVCRCEDVTFARIAEHGNWRAIKLQTRCGMGPCQGRVCGPAVEFLLDIPPDSVRPPIFPVPVGLLSEDL